MRGLFIWLFVIWSFVIWSFVIWSFVIWGQSGADTLILADNGFDTKELSSYLGLFTDSTGELTIQDLLDKPPVFKNDFAPEQPTIYPAAHWVKLDIEAREDINDRWLLFKSSGEYPYLTFISYVDAYYVKDKQLIGHHRSGYMVPKKEKNIELRAAVNVLPFSVAEGEKTSLYIRLSQSYRSYPTKISLELSHPRPTIADMRGPFAWVIFGSQVAFSMIGFYMLAIWFLVRDKSYLYFGIFCLLFSTHYLNLEPVSSFVDRFFPNQPQVSGIFLPLINVSYVFFLLFGRSFSEIKKRLPGWDKYYLFVLATSIIIVLLSYFDMIREPYSLEMNFGIFLIFVLVLPAAIRFVLGKHIFARIFGIGVILFLLWNCMGILWNEGIIQLPFNPWPIGQIGLLIIYGIGLAYKFMDGERQKAQAERIRELDTIKSRFFANISHEFRTPLSLILGPINQAMENIPASESVEDQEEVPIKGRHLKVVKRNALRLQSLVDQLLDLSKLDNGKMKLAVAEGALISFIRSIVFSFESLAERRHIHFNAHFPTEPEDAWFDRDKLEKILVNLLSNAFKFTPEHGKISVKVKEHHGHINILIRDSGPGMHEEEVDKIFDRFYQVEGAESQGTGIGLALVRELVELHGGQISVESIKGEGTTFKVSLPHQRKHFAPEQIAPSNAFEEKGKKAGLFLDAEEVAEPISESAEKLLPLALLVEDNPDLRRYIHENISSHYQVIMAEDGQKGTELAIEKIPDIIISDVMMPKKDGYELCKTLKTDQRTSHIPIILLTAKAEQQNKIEGLERGADDYLTKPFDVRELGVRMNNLIEQRERLREKFSGELKVAPTKLQLNSVDEVFLKSVMEQIEKNMDNEFFSVEELAQQVGFSRSQLHRKIKALTGKSSNQLIREYRLTRAREMLEQNSASVSEIAFQVGYSNLSYFSKSFKDAFGKLPSEV